MDPGAVLHELTKKSPQARWAFLIHENVVHYAGFLGSEGVPSSAAVKLLQGLFERHKDHSFFLLRKRIYLSYQPGPMDIGFISLVAKRWSKIEVSADETANASLPVELRFQEAAPLAKTFYLMKVMLDPTDGPRESIRNRAQALEALRALEAQISRGEVLHDHSRPIAAVLTSASGEVLGQARHEAIVNKTRHAEVELIQQLFRVGFNKATRPEELYRLFVSMKPCRMCAGTWAEVFGRQLEVYYRDDDPGKKARGTQLERLGLERPLDQFTDSSGLE